MRVNIVICAGLIALSTISAQAANGCGYGYKRTQWQDHWGHWHWGHCISKMHRNLSRENMAN